MGLGSLVSADVSSVLHNRATVRHRLYLSEMGGNSFLNSVLLLSFIDNLIQLNGNLSEELLRSS